MAVSFWVSLIPLVYPGHCAAESFNPELPIGTDLKKKKKVKTFTLAKSLRKGWPNYRQPL